MKRILCLWFPLWPIQRLRAAQRRLQTHPLVLYAMDSRQVQRVVECCAAARRCGVRPGLPLTEAAALLERGSGSPRHGASAHSAWHCRPADPEADRAELLRLAELCEQFSPLVGHTTLGPRAARQAAASAAGFTLHDGLLCEIGGVSELQGGEAALLKRIERALRGRAYQARYGVAETIGAAWALARFGSPRDTADPSDDAPAVASHDTHNTWERVRRLPVAALRLTPSLEETLQQLGLLWIEQLAALPRESLVARLGELPGLRLEQLLEESAETLVPHRALPELTVDQWLEYPTAAREAIEAWVERLLRRLAPLLETRQQGALEIVCRLDCAEREPLLLRIGLFEPTARVEHWLELARMQFEQAALPGAVHRVRVEIPRTAPLQQRQGDLFGGQHVHEARLLAGLVDRLSSRLGREAVQRPRLTRDVQPEQAYVSVSATGWPAAGGVPRSTTTTPQNQNPLQRPLVLYSPPRPLDVLAIAPDGPPLRCRIGGLQFEVARWWGPERIETGWWRGTSVRRDYYRVEARTGQRFWIFRRLPHGPWFLQGEFA